MDTVIPQTIPDLIPALIPHTLPDDSYFLPAGLQCWFDMKADPEVDLSGNGVVATFEGCVLTANYGRYFDESSEENIELTGLSIAGTTYSLEFWLRDISTGGVINVFDCETGRRTVSLSAAYNLYISDAASHDTTLVLTEDTWWAHVVCVCDGIVGTGYVNAVAHATADAIQAKALGGAMRLGSNYGGLASFYRGGMGLFRAYNRALTQAEVSALFAQDRARFGV